MKRTKITN